MRSTVEPLEGNKVKLSIEVDEAEFDKAIDAAFRRIAHEVRMPGFRPGKAPRRLLEARLGAEAGRQEALREALPEYYSQAVIDNDVDVIAPPEIEITAGEESGAVSFDATVEVRPSVSVAGYGGLRVELPSPVPTDEEIDAQVDRLRNQFASLDEVERPAADGDLVTIDISGSQDGELLPGLQATDYSYEVGSGAVAAELDENLRGASAGDELTFEATPPGGEDETVTFEVTVKAVKEKSLPEVTDEWAAEVSEFESVDELRADLVNRLTTVRRVQAQMALRDKAVLALVDLVEDEAPEPMVNAEMQNRIQDLSMRLSAQGISAEDYFAQIGADQESWVADLRTGAVQSVKADLALRAVADAEAIEVDDDEVDAEIEALAERVGEKVNKVRKQLERGGQISAVRSDVRKRKALDWLVENVELVDEAGEPIDRAALTIPDAGDEGDDDGEASADEAAETSTGEQDAV